MSGLYFLRKYTRKLRKNQGERVTEDIHLFDEVKCAYPTTTTWIVCLSHGPPSKMVVKGGPPLPPNSDSLFFRISVVVAQMWNNNGKLSWGACINTTGNRVCDPHFQCQFNRERGEFEAVTCADVVELEAKRARDNGFVMIMTVPLDHLVELCAFNGDIDKIAGYLCQDDISEEANQLRLEPPKLPLRSMRGGCSPVKDGEDAEEKLL